MLMIVLDVLLVPPNSHNHPSIDQFHSLLEYFNKWAFVYVGIDSANQLGDVLDALNKEHGFEPPTAPGLRFSRKGRASLEG